MKLKHNQRYIHSSSDRLLEYTGIHRMEPSLGHAAARFKVIQERKFRWGEEDYVLLTLRQCQEQLIEFNDICRLLYD